MCVPNSYSHRYVDYKNITKVIKPGRIVYVDDGVLAFDVLKIKDAKNIEVRARNNGFISSRKGVNLPNTDIDLPACMSSTSDVSGLLY